jgi:hypothetical protein
MMIGTLAVAAAEPPALLEDDGAEEDESWESTMAFKTCFNLSSGQLILIALVSSELASKRVIARVEYWKNFILFLIYCIIIKT